MSNRFVLVAFLAFVTLGSSALHAGEANSHHDEMPEILWEPVEPAKIDSGPIFVADDLAVLPSGEVDSQLLNENAAYWIEQAYLTGEAEEPCRSLHQPSDHFNAPKPDWLDYSSLVAASDLIVVARVTGIRAGVNSHGIGGSLIRLRPMQWLKGEDDWDLKYLFVPVGDLELGGRKICLSHGQYAEMPKDGDRIIMAYQDKWANRNFPWIATSAPQVITLKGNGQGALPRWARSKHPDWVGKPTASLIGEIRSLVRAENGGAQ